MLAVLAYALVQSLVAPVLPEIQRDLHTTRISVIWVLTSWLLSASILTPIFGRLGDRVGKQKMMLVSLIGLVVGSIISAVAPTVGVMIVGRVIQGAAAASSRWPSASSATSFTDARSLERSACWRR